MNERCLNGEQLWLSNALQDVRMTENNYFLTMYRHRANLLNNKYAYISNSVTRDFQGYKELVWSPFNLFSHCLTKRLLKQGVSDLYGFELMEHVFT